jgi:hypothetical protein
MKFVAAYMYIAFAVSAIIALAVCNKEKKK